MIEISKTIISSDEILEKDEKKFIVYETKNTNDAQINTKIVEFEVESIESQLIESLIKKD